jgi:hypothetical protein
MPWTEVLARYGFPAHEVLQRERAACEELLAEILTAPPERSVFAEQKWARQALVDILRGLGAPSAEVAAHLTALRDNDAARRGYYDDELSRTACEALLAPALSDSVQLPRGALQAQARGLTSLHATQHWLLLERVDLRANRLFSWHGIAFLAHVRELLLDDNALAAVPRGVLSPLRALTLLSLARNRLAAVDQLAGLADAVAGAAVVLTGNAVLAAADYPAWAALATIVVVVAD